MIGKGSEAIQRQQQRQQSTRANNQPNDGAAWSDGAPWSKATAMGTARSSTMVSMVNGNVMKRHRFPFLNEDKLIL
jgi:hypothetical protein